MGAKQGFVKKYTVEIPELNSVAIGYLHKPTEAEVLFLKNKDDNKVFGINFRTPPKDATGLPHILEHSVLCGSRKYPVKEPFVELLKGSLQTFLNAFTYPDKTCYPVASVHYKDFHNLIDVYLDAVFFPRLTPEIFMQEGWHYHLEKPDNPLEIRGVVYNEMKGAYSSPERILIETVQQSLFPDHPYSFDSGGDPDRIPSLTYDSFVDFHKNYYHPSNSRIFFYGDLKIDDELQLLGEYLREFDFKKVNSKIPPIKPLPGFQRIEKSYAVSNEKESNGKAFATLNWLLTESNMAELNFAFQILHYILLGMPGSPLRRALIESGLGEDIAGIGLETELRYLYFSTGLKGMKAEDVDSMVNLIDDVLNKLARDGIPESTVEAAINTIEFRYRELNTGSFPRGLALMLESLTTWLYDFDPLLLLAFEKPLESVKEQFKKDKFYFSRLIEKYFLGNTHKTLVVLSPDPQLMSMKEAEERARLDSIKASWNKEQLQEVINVTLKLKELQSQPDKPEDLAKIPRLSRNDLDIDVTPVAVNVIKHSGNSIIFLHELETHGIVYIDLGFNFNCLPKDKLPLLPLFCSALMEMGTEKEDYVSFSERISRKTGGLRPKILIRNSFKDDMGIFVLFLRGKALRSQVGELVSILDDMVNHAIFDSKDRLYQLILKHKAMRYHKLVPEGHRTVLRRLQSHFSLAGGVKELVSGISQYFFVKKLAENFDTEWQKIREDLYFIKDLIFNRSNFILNITADEDFIKGAEETASTLIDSLKPNMRQLEDNRSKWSIDGTDQVEGFTLPIQVHYVATGNKVPFHNGVPGSFLVVLNLLRTSWLWEKVRVQGGAYGAHCFFDRASKVLVMTSYRDPHLIETVDTFKKSVDFLRNTKLSEEDITKNVIGTYGKLDPPMFPDAKSYVSVIRHLTGETEEMRRKLREEIIATDNEDIASMADVLKKWSETNLVKVLGPESSIKASKETIWKDMVIRPVD